MASVHASAARLRQVSWWRHGLGTSSPELKVTSPAGQLGVTHGGAIARWPRPLYPPSPCPDGVGYVVLLTTLRPPDVIKLPPYLMLSLSCGRAPRPGLILVHLNTRTGHRGATPCCPVPVYVITLSLQLNNNSAAASCGNWWNFTAFCWLLVQFPLFHVHLFTALDIW